MKIHHIALKTKNYAPVADFYKTLFNLTEINHQTGYSYWLSNGDIILMIEQENNLPDTRTPHDVIIFSIEKDRVDTFISQAAKTGIVPFKNTNYTWYFRDPDGRTCGISFYQAE